MRALDLDFIRPPGQARRRALLAVLAAAALLAAALAQGLQQRRELARAESALATAQAQARAPAHAQRLAPQTDESRLDEATRLELARARQVLAALNLGWPGLIQQLEGRRVPGVTLLSIQPDGAQAQRLRLGGEARQMEQALAYVQQLGSAPGLAQVHLVSHEWVAGERPVLRFALLADWAAPVPGATAAVATSAAAGARSPEAQARTP